MRNIALRARIWRCVLAAIQVASASASVVAGSSLLQPTAAAAAGTISGKVFQDFNANGALDSAAVGALDRGVSGLRGTAYAAPAKHPVATFEKLTTWYYADAPHQHREHLEAARRASTFAEVVKGLDEQTAQFEARRCMSCGNCFACDNCFGVCPDNAVKKTGIGHGYEIDYDYCKGCGICVAEIGRAHV